MIRLIFRPWRTFFARKDLRVVTRWLARVAVNSERIFKAGMRGGHSGRIYRRSGRYHQASAPGEYPAVETGRLIASMRAHSTINEAQIGTNMPYSRWLRTGTRHMARRKMSQNALVEGRLRSGQLGRWVKWQR